MTETEPQPCADLFPFRSHFFETDSGRMHYVDEGPREGPPLVMVHGNPTWSFFFRELVRALRGRYRVVALDHLGCGLSDKPQNYEYTLENHIRNLGALTKHLGLSDVTLFLHDWGGAIGMGHAVRCPDFVRRFVIFNTAAFPSSRIPPSISFLRIPGVGPLCIRGLNAFAHGALARCVRKRKRLTPSVRSGYLAPYANWRDRVAHLRFVQDIPMRRSHPSYALLSSISDGLEQFKNRPMMIVWGGADFVFNRDFFDEWSRRFPAAETHYLEEAGHYVLEDAHETIVPWVNRFLEA